MGACLSKVGKLTALLVIMPDSVVVAATSRLSLVSREHKFVYESVEKTYVMCTYLSDDEPDKIHVHVLGGVMNEI